MAAQPVPALLESVENIQLSKIPLIIDQYSTRYFEYLKNASNLKTNQINTGN